MMLARRCVNYRNFVPAVQQRSGKRLQPEQRSAEAFR
jgi:hypothetical protein